MKRRYGLVLSLTIIAATSIIGIYWFLNRDNSLSRLKDSGVIRIGYAVEAPYAFIRPGGEVSGESPEVARAIVTRLGIARIEWYQMEFSELIPELRAGRIDVIAAGMFITKDRAQRVTFSEPTFHVHQALLVARGNPRQLHSYRQVVEQPNVKIAVLSGSVEEKMLENMGLPAARRVVVPDALAGQVAVESGLADGLALSSPTVQWMAMNSTSGKSELAAPFEPYAAAEQARSGYGGFAFRQEDRQLLQAWNAELKGFVGSEDHRKLMARFGFSASDLPGNTTTQEILAP